MQSYNQCSSAPKIEMEKLRKHTSGLLKDLIDTSNEIGILKDDVKNLVMF